MRTFAEVAEEFCSMSDTHANRARLVGAFELHQEGTYKGFKRIMVVDCGVTVENRKGTISVILYALGEEEALFHRHTPKTVGEMTDKLKGLINSYSMQKQVVRVYVAYKEKGNVEFLKILGFAGVYPTPGIANSFYAYYKFESILDLNECGGVENFVHLMYTAKERAREPVKFIKRFQEGDITASTAIASGVSSTDVDELEPLEVEAVENSLNLETRNVPLDKLDRRRCLEDLPSWEKNSPARQNKELLEVIDHLTCMNIEKEIDRALVEGSKTKNFDTCAVLVKQLEEIRERLGIGV